MENGENVVVFIYIYLSIPQVPFPNFVSWGGVRYGRGGYEQLFQKADLSQSLNPFKLPNSCEIRTHAASWGYFCTHYYLTTGGYF